MTGSDVELADGEQLMSDADELIFRQIAPHMLMDDGKIASTAFGPNRSDDGMPSYARSAKVTAQEARDWHMQHAASPSCGVWAVLVGEVIAGGRYAIDDSSCELASNTPRPPWHCFVDFRRMTRPERKSLCAHLYMCAIGRGEIPTRDPREDGFLFADPRALPHM